MTLDTQNTRLDTAFARFLSQKTRLAGKDKQAFESLVMAVSTVQNLGHSCTLLSEDEKALVLGSGLAAMPLPDMPTLPLVVDNNRLYLHRYWFYENRLAAEIKRMLEATYRVENLDAQLDRYFGVRVETDWQREAAKLAVQQSFCIITGGPGTGKTTTVVKLLALLQELSATPLHIALTAPTGKAAVRLQESIGKNIEGLPCTDEIKAHIPRAVVTIHRLLGAIPSSPSFRHNEDKPLPFDVVVVDEASMVDLALMSKLQNALKQGARLILLGDKDQLASVESGAVLADLAGALPAQTAELKVSFRFEANIKKLAEAINQQQAAEAWQLLQADDDMVGLLNEDLTGYIIKRKEEYLRLIKKQAKFTDVFSAFSKFQVLCSNRQGVNSVDEINKQVEKNLAAHALIEATGLWYSGKPVMVTKNAPDMKLYNGDIGLCMPDDEQNGKLMVFFQRADGSVKKVLPARVPEAQTAFAMTIHKSQGSEFEEVLIALPEKINAVLTKELLYTAVTRAKQKIRLACDEAVFNAAVMQKVERHTGLAEKFN